MVCKRRADRKFGDAELTLRQYPVESAMAVDRVAKVCDEINIEFQTEGAELIDDPIKAAQLAAQHGLTPNQIYHLLTLI